MLKELWANGPLAVRPLHELCAQSLNWSFSSTRKTLERMEDKGFVTLEKPVKGAAIYRARVSKTMTLANMTKDFSNRVLELNGPVPTALFTNSKILSDEDLDELAGLLG